jgi:hypothetical protein
VPISIFEVALSKFRELQAARTVLLGEIEELKNTFPTRGTGSVELKEAHYRAQLESPKRGSSTYFRSQKELPQRWNEKYTRPSLLSRIRSLLPTPCFYVPC